MNESSKKIALVMGMAAAMGMPDPFESLRSAERFKGQSEEEAKKAIDKAAAKRERRRLKRVKS